MRDMMNMINEALLRLYIAFGGSIHYINSGEALPPPLTKDEESRLMEELLKGNDSVKQTLIERNLRLVVYIARRFEKFKDEMDCFRICHYIRCFQTGLNAAGIFPRYRVM